METENTLGESGVPDEERFGLLRTILRWGFPIVLFLIALILGFVGFRQHALEHGHERGLRDLVYLSFQLFTLESGGVEPPVPAALEAARWIAPILPIYAAILGFLALIRRFVRSESVRLYRDHVVICGAGLKGMTLARNLIESGWKVVVLESDAANPNLRLLERLGIPFFIGDATVPQIFRRARIHQARHLVVLCGEDQTNVSVAVAARSLWEGRHEGDITCHIDVENREACRALIEKELHDSETPRCWLEFHKSDDIAAEALLCDEARVFEERDGSSPPHILFLGLDSMGRSFLLRAARMWSRLADSKQLKLQYSIVGAGFDEALASTLDRHPPLQRWTMHNEDLLSIRSLKDLKIRYGEAGASVDEGGRPGIDLVFICAAADTETLSKALEIHRLLRGVAPDTPILVPTYENEGFSRFLPGPEDDCGYYRSISVVSVLEKSFTTSYLKMGTIERMARRVHRVYRELNPGAPPWESLDEDLQMANYAQARRVFEHLSNRGFRIDPSREWAFEPLILGEELVEELARVEHERWQKEREKRGWRKGRRTESSRLWDRLFPWRWKRRDSMDEWERIPEADRKITRHMVSCWPMVLADVGFDIRPGGPSPGERPMDR